MSLRYAGKQDLPSDLHRSAVIFGPEPSIVNLFVWKTAFACGERPNINFASAFLSFEEQRQLGDEREALRVCIADLLNFEQLRMRVHPRFELDSQS
jgi:hypothetical protein